MSAKRLTAEHKAFLVQALAQFETPKEAAAALKGEYGAAISPQGAEVYDPTKRAGRQLSQRWCELFYETRRRFLKRLEDIPEAHKAVRIRRLAHASRVYKARGNYRHMADMLERIAKEVGDVYSNRRELTGKSGGPMRMDYSHLTDEQPNARIAQLLGVTGLTVLGEKEGRSASPSLTSPKITSRYSES
ncbi:DUF2280 domain-containing protein [Nitrococcus mobilis]|uniref:Uncharacterized protein n=1 Tax=Nitrococcus mobilis Nb-231 TaxID=314278 RepID=A4BN38_9GAMM|nr:DUF2280 domain-containing protein [Nitrococcus mobilis]EAR22637.1 hypothetical protein NB231_09303 [Nitrococcus mobilis Nb-231]